MIPHITDAVLLLALVLTSIRVAAMHRELRRLRSYHAEYREVFGQTSQAVDSINAAVRHIGRESRDALPRLEAAIKKAKALSRRLEDMACAAEGKRMPAEATGDLGTDRQRVAVSEHQVAGPRNEILRFAADSRQPPQWRADSAGEAGIPPPRQSGRSLRLAPGTKTSRAAGGNG